MKGLICAGGSATRLAELTRVTNKHLLPVGSWPMVYYPLQVLQRIGVREVLLVTGQQHAGQFIDLLGDGKVEERGGGELLFELELTYKVQTEPGGIAQVVGMARDFAADDRLVVCVGDTRYESPPSSDAVVGLYCYPPEVFEIVETREPSSRGELEITDVNREFARRGELQVQRVEGWWHDGGKHWQDLAEVGRLIEQTGVNK